MNAINIIAPYKHLGTWVFDDPRVGLMQEPFVAGADKMIDRVVAAIPGAEKGFIMVFLLLQQLIRRLRDIDPARASGART